MDTPKILVIDDDKLVRWSLTTILTRAGYRVREAATGTDGLAAVQDIMPDLVILDIMLPDVNGFDVLMLIHRWYPDLPVLMMTAYATTETARKAESLGARGHLDKPCDGWELRAAVSEALESPRPPIQKCG